MLGQNICRSYLYAELCTIVINGVVYCHSIATTHALERILNSSLSRHLQCHPQGYVHSNAKETSLRLFFMILNNFKELLIFLFFIKVVCT
jgi:hypothetical protein